MFSLQPVFKSSLALLVFLVPSASVVFAQQDVLMTSDDNNTDSSSLLMTNYNALREEGQGFYLLEGPKLYEKPSHNMTSRLAVQWLCDLEFVSEDATNQYGYVGRGVQYAMGSFLDFYLTKESEPSKKWTLSVSAVLVPTLGIFEGQFHGTTDDWVNRYWDDGTSTLPILGWEGHDEGDTHPNADTSAWSGSGTLTKITAEAAAELLGADVVDMTPETCRMEYEAAWNTTHVPDPIDTSVTKLEETVAELQADNKELLSRIVAIEGSITANGSSSGDDGKPTATSSSSPFMAWYEHATMDVVMKSIMTVVIIIGLVAIDFI